MSFALDFCSQGDRKPPHPIALISASVSGTRAQIKEKQ